MLQDGKEVEQVEWFYLDVTEEEVAGCVWWAGGGPCCSWPSLRRQLWRRDPRSPSAARRSRLAQQTGCIWAPVGPHAALDLKQNKG